MSELIDYLEWRGDLTFEHAPFNDVDNLILSLLSYISFDGIVPGISYDETVSLSEACERFYMMHSEQELEEDKSFTRNVPDMMKKLAQTARFKDMQLGKYVSKLDYNEEKQFSAIHFYLDDQTLYVAYRGTDDTILGWKEDFNMSFMMPVPSQIEAVRYLNETLKPPYKRLYIGGHSKGGNLAIYAGINCHPSIKPHIQHIYNNDGPGFNKLMLETPQYQEMLPYITTIVPQSSIIGMLLEHEEEYIVVKSKESGLMQHDALSWEVLGPNFVCCEDLSTSSQILDHSIKAWLHELTPAQREFFIEALYNIIDTAGVKNLSQLYTSKFKKIGLLFKTYNSMDEDTKAMLTETIKQLTNCYFNVFKDTLLPGSSKTKEKEDSRHYALLPPEK